MGAFVRLSYTIKVVSSAVILEQWPSVSFRENQVLESLNFIDCPSFARILCPTPASTDGTIVYVYRTHSENLASTLLMGHLCDYD